MLTADRLRVLVVDNVPDAADSLALLLKLWDHDAAVFYDGAEAVAAAGAYRPHVVLLDVAMPGMDGFQVAGRLRAMPELGQVVLVGVTGYGDAARRNRARAGGFDHYFVKPMDPYQLQELLARIAEQQELARVQQADAGALVRTACGVS